MKLIQIDKLLPRKLYYTLCLLSFTPVIINILSNASLFSTTQFTEGELFHYPIYNINYYLTLTFAIAVIFMYIPILKYGLKNAPTKQYVNMYKILLNGVYFAIGWHVVFGFLKANLGFTRFSVRGKAKVKNEMGLALMATNLRKYTKRGA